MSLPLGQTGPLQKTHITTQWFYSPQEFGLTEGVPPVSWTRLWTLFNLTGWASSWVLILDRECNNGLTSTHSCPPPHPTHPPHTSPLLPVMWCHWMGANDQWWPPPLCLVFTDTASTLPLGLIIHTRETYICMSSTQRQWSWEHAVESFLLFPLLPPNPAEQVCHIPSSERMWAGCCCCNYYYYHYISIQHL